jgi:hypothetical protein
MDAEQLNDFQKKQVVNRTIISNKTEINRLLLNNNRFPSKALALSLSR